MMRLDRVGHLLRAAAAVSGQSRFVVVGSASILLRCRGIPADMLMTPEIDLYAPDADDVEATSDLIDGTIGQGSSFHAQFGYHADGVSPGTARMPADWRDRAMERQAPGAPGIAAVVPDPDDIALSKLSAWRDKDRAWLASGARARILSPARMAARLASMPAAVPGDGFADRDELARRLRSLCAEAGLAPPANHPVDPGAGSPPGP